MTKKEIIELLKDKPDKSWLFYMADETRKKYCGDGILFARTRGIFKFLQKKTVFIAVSVAIIQKFKDIG